MKVKRIIVNSLGTSNVVVVKYWEIIGEFDFDNEEILNLFLEKIYESFSELYGDNLQVTYEEDIPFNAEDTIRDGRIKEWHDKVNYPLDK